MATAVVARAERTAILARASGLHPALVKRLVSMGAIDQEEPLSNDEAAARLARCVRLRRDLGVNWAGAILACQLLARIDELEARPGLYER
jgi:hypothetical protein